MKKRFFALLTAVCIALTTGLTTGLTALADGGENSDMTIGMSTQEQCSCTTLCTEGNINPDCPVCGAEGADLTACKGAPLMMRAAPLAATVENITYLDENGTQQTAASATQVTNSDTQWTDGWYVAQSNITIDGTVTISGNVHLILEDGCNLTVNGGILLQSDGNMYIYAQSTEKERMGSLTATGTDAGFKEAGYDGTQTLTIAGGKISASGSDVGISAVNLTITDGYVSALGTDLYGDSIAVYNATISGGFVDLYGDFTGTLSTGIDGHAVISSTGEIKNIAADCKGFFLIQKTGKIYGDTFTLTQDLNIANSNIVVTVEEGQTLTLDDGVTLTIPVIATLTNNGIVNNNGTIINTGTLNNSGTLNNNGNLNNTSVLNNAGSIINNGTLTGEVGGSGTVTPKITTDSLSDGTVDTAYNQALTATGNNIKWGVTSGNLPTELRLSEDGKITGTPTTAGTYKFTVTATNNAGSDSKEFTLTIGVAPVYSITADPLKLDFGTLTEGYTPASQMVTITNNGNQPLTLNEPVSTEHFEVGNLSKTELAVGEEVTFTVQPKAGLAAGTYSENIDVTASNNVTLSIPASLTVQKASVPTKPEVPSTGTTSGGSTGESTYPDVEDAQTSYEQATRDFWNRTINKIKKADEGDSLRIYIGIHKEIPGDVIQAIRENGVNVTFYNQDGDEVTVYAESAPTKYQAVWTLKQLGNYVLTEQQTPAAQEESPADQQPADEPTTPTQPAETEAVDTAKPNPSTGEGSGAVIAMIAAAAALAGLGATLRKR
ncbi:hypothetical protein [Negativibacillus massiliensis]|uniref:hypothetical protein n=1 Tax=Negativibacillus massiliensis TaxID=1871035 RepID=UPI002A82B78F|nr:hypothetical protein [Negativibacillus massiliensis]MDY4048402.1 hypothetical protein [Negativibacillus massiliensis]